jgi:hypothetical protein
MAAMNVARWVGGGWHAVGGRTDGEVLGLAVDGLNHLYAAGDFSMAGGVPVSRVALWDGADWSSLGTGLDARAASLAIDG